MSTILEALAHGRIGAKARRASRSASEDAILATLGFNRPSPSTRAARAASFALGVLACFFGAYLVWLWLAWPARAAQTHGRQPPVTRTARKPPDVSQPQPPATAVHPIQAAASSTPSGPVAARAAATPAPAPVVPHEGSLSALVRAPAVTRVPPDGAVQRRQRVDGRVPEAPQQNAPAGPASAHETPIALQTTSPSGSDFELAVYYQRSGEFEKAIVRYQAVLQRDPLNVEAHNNLGLLYKDKGLLEDAAREFQRALFIDSRYLRARNNLAVTLLDQGHVDAAIAELNAALTLAPRSVDTLVNLALARKAAGQNGDARGLLVRALGLDSRNAAAHYTLAVEYEATGEAARALEHYRAFLQYAGPEYGSRLADVRARVAALEPKVK